MKDFFELNGFKATQTIRNSEYEASITGQVFPCLERGNAPEFTLRIETYDKVEINAYVSVNGAFADMDATLYLQAAQEANSYVQRLKHKCIAMQNSLFLAVESIEREVQLENYNEALILATLITSYDAKFEKDDKTLIDRIVNSDHLVPLINFYEELVLSEGEDNINYSSKEIRLIKAIFKTLLSRSSLVTNGNNLDKQRVAAIRLLRSGESSAKILKERELYLKIQEMAEAL